MPRASIRRGSLDDLAWLVPIIKSEIPQKKDVTLEEVRKKCEAGCSIAVAEIGGIPTGGTIMLHQGDTAYIWLGAYKEKGRGFGTETIRVLLDEAAELGFSKTTVKTHEKNGRALAVLSKFGFKQKESIEGIVLLETILANLPIHF